MFHYTHPITQPNFIEGDYMKETIVITYVSSKPEQARGNAKSRYKAARAAKFAKAQQDKQLSRSIVKTAFDASERTVKALTMPTMKSKEPQSTACCLPDIAKFAVNAKKPERITAR